MHDDQAGDGRAQEERQERALYRARHVEELLENRYGANQEGITAGEDDQEDHVGLLFRARSTEPVHIACHKTSQTNAVMVTGEDGSLTRELDQCVGVQPTVRSVINYLDEYSLSD